MLVSARSPLTVAAAAVVVAGVVAASPDLAPSSAPRIVSTPVTLDAVHRDWLLQAGADIFDSAPTLPDDTIRELAHSYTYTPNVSGPSVSHPVGLISQLLQDAKNPPILEAITSAGGISPVFDNVYFQTTITKRIDEYQSYAAAANAVINKFVGHAVNDTVTPAQWGGGKVLTDWANAASAWEALTVGIGATVDAKWVPSIRVAAISTRNQIANNILGTQKHPNYARDYTPETRTESGSISNSGAPSFSNSAASTFASGRAHQAARMPTATHTAAASTARPAASRR